MCVCVCVCKIISLIGTSCTSGRLHVIVSVDYVHKIVQETLKNNTCLTVSSGGFVCVCVCGAHVLAQSFLMHLHFCPRCLMG